MSKHLFLYLTCTLILLLMLNNVSSCFSEQGSEVLITDLSTDKIIYDLGENVTIKILLKNMGEAKDLIVSTLIKSYRMNDVVDSMSLKTLHNVVGEASFSMIWDSKDFPVCDYYVEVMLNDTYGNLLDRRTCGFRLGRPMISVANFNVEPQHFKIGDEVKISLEAINTGSISLSGSCIFMIKDESGSIWHSYHIFSSLAPKDSIKFTSIWNTSSAKKGALYYVIGYVSYESQTTLPMMIMISTNYLPIAKFSYTPTKIGLGEYVTFDASASSDPDGSISSYKWEFGDGGEGSGVNVKHSYHGLGDYMVTLTITDNEGGSNSTKELIRVVMMYNLNVSSNVAVEITGSGRYREGDEVTLTAPSSISMPGLAGLLGAKYVFKQWIGKVNSTEPTVTLVFFGYRPKLEMRAIYVEDYVGAMLTTSIIVVALVGVAIFYIRRRKGKGARSS